MNNNSYLYPPPYRHAWRDDPPMSIPQSSPAGPPMSQPIGVFHQIMDVSTQTCDDQQPIGTLCMSIHEPINLKPSIQSLNVDLIDVHSFIKSGNLKSEFLSAVYSAYKTRWHFVKSLPIQIVGDFPRCISARVYVGDANSKLNPWLTDNTSKPTKIRQITLLVIGETEPYV